MCKTPIKNPYLIIKFQPELAFLKETQFYAEIIPLIAKFENELKIPLEQKLDVFINCIGHRISLDSGEKHFLL